MGWFDEQIKQKVKQDEMAFSDALRGMAGAVMGKERIWNSMQDERSVAVEAIGRILAFYRVKPREIPGSLKDLESILEYLLRPSGIMRRQVLLKGEWYKDGTGAMLGTYRKSRKAVALIPDGASGYLFAEEETGREVKVTAENADQIAEAALCFYKPLPLKEIHARDLIVYALQTLSASDFAAVLFAAAAVSVIGIFPVCANWLIFEKGILPGGLNVLLSCTILLLGCGIVTVLFRTIQQMLLAKMKTRMSIFMESAAMMRVLTLPAKFFRQYSTGELAGRLQDLNGICDMALEAALTVGTALISFFVCMAQIYAFAPPLVVPVLLIVLAFLLLLVLQSAAQIRVRKESMELSAKESGLVFSLFLGIQKIRLSGAQQRAFGKWAKQYTEKVKLEYHPPLFVSLEPVLRTAVLLIGNILIYAQAIRSQIQAADYMSFHVAYTVLVSAFSMLASMSVVFGQICAAYDMLRPILQEVPEVSEDKQIVTRISGGIELTNVSFRYQESMPMLFENLSLKIRPGQYVAIVGKTGCGKSTLMRLMLGFEQPQKGAVYYDGKDLAGLDLKSLRKFMGVVMQNGKVFQGSIYSNIVISAPWLTMEDAWRAAEMAGLAEDIRQMPMGMHTLIAEGGAGFSGGQKQRLMIARAVAAKPKLLFFDEATSALDNMTQKIVSESLDKLKCTKVVIAHRLSTIRQCDRIVVLDKGKIIEDGTYEELISRNGFFAELVERQRVEG